MNDKVSELKQKYLEIVEQNNETHKQFSEVTQEKNRLYTVASEQTQTIDLCVNNNKKLYEINRDLLVKYENKGVLDSHLVTN